MEVSGQHHASVALTLGQKACTHCTGGWFSLRVSMELVEKRRISCKCGVSNPTPFCKYLSVTVPTALFWFRLNDFDLQTNGEEKKFDE